MPPLATKLDSVEYICGPIEKNVTKFAKRPTVYLHKTSHPLHPQFLPLLLLSNLTARNITNGHKYVSRQAGICSSMGAQSKCSQKKWAIDKDNSVV